MSYAALKHIHLLAIALSLALFLFRGALIATDSGMLRAKWVRITPHVIDTVLLLSAVWLAVTLGLSPGEQPWLLAKVVALLAYIVLGVIAIRPGRAKAVRMTAFFAALVVFAYIVSVALSRNPMPFA